MNLFPSPPSVLGRVEALVVMNLVIAETRARKTIKQTQFKQICLRLIFFLKVLHYG